MELNSQKTKTYFHNRAAQFDSLYDEENAWQFYLNKIFRKALYERVRLTVNEFENPPFTVCDIGCGSGRNSVIFAKTGASRVFGVDFADNMIAIAREYSASQPEGAACEFVKGDAMQVPVGEKFDYVVALGVFDYIEDPRPLLARMAQMANRKVIASFPGISMLRAPLRKIRYTMRSCPVFFFGRPRLREIAKDVGLTNFELLPCTGTAGSLLVAKVGD